MRLLRVLAFLSATAGPAWAAATYTVTAVSTLAGGAMAGPSGSLSNGILTGTSDASMTNVGYIPLGFTPTGLTNSGQITGDFSGQILQGYPGASYYQDYFYNGSGWYGLTNPLIAGDSGATGMDSLGDLAGWVANGYGGTDAIVWQNNGTWLDLNSLGSGYWSMTPTAMSSTGDVTGQADGKAFLYNGTTVTSLTPLSGGSATGEGVSDNGLVAGEASLLSGAEHAFYTNALEQTFDLGTLGGFDSIALGVNAGGEVVGWADTSGGVEHGFVYVNGTLVDLNTLLGGNGTWTIESAIAINDAGAILALAVNSLGQQQYVVLAPQTPEPGSWQTMLAGLVALLGWKFRARRGVRKGKVSA